jgi:hypothetical protein
MGMVLPITVTINKFHLFFFTREYLNYRVLNLFLKSFSKKMKQVLCKQKNPLIFAPALGLGEDVEGDVAVLVSLYFSWGAGLFLGSANGSSLEYCKDNKRGPGDRAPRRGGA